MFGVLQNVDTFGKSKFVIVFNFEQTERLVFRIHTDTKSQIFLSHCCCWHWCCRCCRRRSSSSSWWSLLLLAYSTTWKPIQWQSSKWDLVYVHIVCSSHNCAYVVCHSIITLPTFTFLLSLCFALFFPYLVFFPLYYVYNIYSYQACVFIFTVKLLQYFSQFVIVHTSIVRYNTCVVGTKEKKKLKISLGSVAARFTIADSVQ